MRAYALVRCGCREIILYFIVLVAAFRVLVRVTDMEFYVVSANAMLKFDNHAWTVWVYLCIDRMCRLHTVGL